MIGNRIFAVFAAAAVVIAGVVGCDNPETTEKPNRPPEVTLSSGPANGAGNVNYKVHFYWHGYDPDGRVENFEYLVTNDEVTGSLIIDEDIYERLAALDAAFPEVDYRWRAIEVHDTILSVTADSIPDPGDDDDAIYFYGDDRFLFRAHHTFFIRAVDEDGAISERPAHRTFTATTIAPEVKINHPSDIGGIGGYDDLPPDVFFRWTGNDSVGDGTVIEPDSTRFALLKRGDLGLDTQFSGRLLDFPDSLWSVWRGWDQVDSLDENIGGRRALITGLTPSSQGGGAGRYLFFVQAKDEAGAISSHYEDGKNLRKLRIVSSLAPRVTISERTLGVRVSSISQSYDYTIAENQPLQLSWSASASEYGSEITGYRYGWDILDSANDEEWSSWALTNTATQAVFVSGSHSFWLEARDYSGTTTRIVYRFVIVPFTMERELLFIDDYTNVPTENPLQGWPLGQPYTWGTFPHNNDQQKAFWDTILEEYSGYDPVVDFFRVTTVNRVPPFETVAVYKRLLWEVKEVQPTESGLGRISRFVDVFRVSTVPFDFLSAFLDRGGQLLLCGGNPVLAMLPTTGDMGNEDYERRMPMAFLKHLGYSQGSSSESQAAVGRFLPFKHFGLDAVVKGTDQDPRSFDWAGPDWKTNRQFWGLYGAGYPGNELAQFPNTVGWTPGDTLRFLPQVYQWFNAAGQFFNSSDPSAVNCTGEVSRAFGLSSVEIYNWDFFRVQFEPPLNYRTSKYIPLLTYVSADPETRWGATPSPDMCYLTPGGEHHDEAGYALTPPGQHAIAVVGLQNPASPSVLIGFPPYYLAPDEAQGLIDHILIDMFGMTK